MIVSHDMSDNALSRAYVLWQLARECGWEAIVAGQVTTKLWPGATEPDFAGSCIQLPSSPVAMTRELTKLAGWATCIVACKAYPTSFGIARVAAARTATPLVVDIDDFDIEHYLAAGWRGLAEVVKASVGSRDFRKVLRDITGLHNPWVARTQRRALRRVPRFAASPTLIAHYGGRLLPAARRPFETVAPHGSDKPVVGFLGTVRPHKGIEKLRAAVERLAPEGFTLLVTADAPADAKEWETWTGAVGYDRVRELLQAVDIVAVPSSTSGETSVFANGQLSIKLLDAMAAGRACVVSDMESLRWGLSGTGVVVADDEVDSLVEALRPLADPATRQAMGDAARRRSATMFELKALTPVFGAVVVSATQA